MPASGFYMKNTGVHGILINMKLRFSKRIFAAAALFAILLSGCTAEGFSLLATPTPVPTPSPTPSPTSVPTPVPVVAVFGADASLSFSEGVADYADGEPYRLEFVSGDVGALSQYRPEGAAAAIVFLENSGVSLPEAEIPVYAYAADGQSVSSSVKHLTYGDTNAAIDTLNLAIAYPPHETPVRMIGLFASKTGRAYIVWNRAVDAGRVFEKAVFVESGSDRTADEWLMEQFAAFYPGMLDAVFAETGALAVSAAQILDELGRDDVEVFAAATDANADCALSPVLVAVTGADLYRAGELCCEGAQALLYGEEARSSIMLPTLFRFSPES